MCTSIYTHIFSCLLASSYLCEVFLRCQNVIQAQCRTCNAYRNIVSSCVISLESSGGDPLRRSTSQLAAEALQNHRAQSGHSQVSVRSQSGLSQVYSQVSVRSCKNQYEMQFWWLKRYHCKYTNSLIIVMQEMLGFYKTWLRPDCRPDWDLTETWLWPDCSAIVLPMVLHMYIMSSVVLVRTIEIMWSYVPRRRHS